MKNERDPESFAQIQHPGAVKLTDWAKEPTVMDLKEDLTAANPAHNAHVLDVKRWAELRDITGKSKPKKVEGRSQVQPKLIRRQAEWRYSALSEPFLSAERLFKVDPVTFEDEAAAKQNDLLLNHQFRTRLNKVKFIDEYVRTGVDEGSVIVRLGWNREIKKVPTQVPVYDYVEISSEEEFQVLQQALEMKQTNPRGFLDLPTELQAAAEYFLETEVPTTAVQVGVQDTVEDKIIRNHPTVQVLNPANVHFDPSCEGDFAKSKFVIISFETTKAELMKDKRYKNLDAVAWSSNTVLALPDHETKTPNDFHLKDELRRPVVAYEYWGLWDCHDTGELKPIVATWIGNVMIRMQENPFPDEEPPIVVVPYLPVKRQVTGEPDAEILEDNQAILGAITRGMIDLMGRSANAQQGTAKGFLDVVNKRRFDNGGDYEFNPGNGDPRMSVYQHTYPEIPNSAMLMVNLQNAEAEALSGVKAFSGGLSGEAYGDVATGIKGMLDAAAKREMNILRRLAKGIQQIGVKIIAMNSVFLSEPEVIRVTNREYVTVKREDIQGNFDLIVDINTAEVDQAKAQDLGFMLQTMGPNMPPALSQLILGEIADLKRMPGLAERIRTFQPEPDPMIEQMKQLELAKLQKEIEKLDSEIALNLAKAEESKSTTDLKNLEFIEEESGTKHAREMQKTGAQAEANADLEVTKALLKTRKPEESQPDIAAAVGYNALVDREGLAQ